MESLTSKRQRCVAAACPPPPGSTAASDGRRSRRKRQRKQQQRCRDVEDTAASCRGGGDEGAGDLELGQDAPCEYEVCLYVRWQCQEGSTRVTRLPLDPITSVGDLRGLFSRLIQGAFSGSALPDYLTSPDFYKFSPAEDFIWLPGDIARPHFRLVVTLGGWEYGVVERELVLGVQSDPEQNLLVTMASFESEPFHMDGQECVMELVAYPTICVRRGFLDRAVRDLLRGRGTACGGGSSGGEAAAGAAAATTGPPAPRAPTPALSST